jgi:tol-pal system protein YbgF
MTSKLSLGILLSGIALWATAAPAAQDFPSDRLARIEAGTQALAQRVGAGEVQVAQASGVPSSLAADFEVRLQRLEQTLQDLTGRVEETSHQAAQANDAIRLMREDYEFRFQALERGGAPGGKPGEPPVVGGGAPTVTPPVAGKAGQSAAMPPAAASGQPPAKLGATTPSAPLQPQAAAPAAPAAAGGDPQAEYDRAYAILRTEDWDKAEKAFSAFVARNPKNAMAGNAQYWLGETFYVRRKFQDAAVAFAEGFKSYPTNNKAPDNLLKLGLALNELGKQKEACTAYGQLIDRFPGASVAIKRRADAERKKLACK